MVLEKTIVNEILAYLRQRGCFAEKLHGGPYQRAGMPDVIASVPWVIDHTVPAIQDETICFGRLVGIEVKRPGEEPTALQYHVGREIKDAGGIWFWVTSLEDVKKELPWLS